MLPSDPEEDPERVLDSYFSSRKWFIRASREAREHLLSQRDSLEGFRVHVKGVMAVSTRICETGGVLQPSAALGVCTKTRSNGEICRKQHIVSLIPRPGFQMRAQGGEGCSGPASPKRCQRPEHGGYLHVPALVLLQGGCSPR